MRVVARNVKKRSLDEKVRNHYEGQNTVETTEKGKVVYQSLRDRLRELEIRDPKGTKARVVLRDLEKSLKRIRER